MQQRISSLGFPLPDNVAAKLTAYPSTVTIPIQWGYQDLYGHVNNVRMRDRAAWLEDTWRAPLKPRASPL